MNRVDERLPDDPLPLADETLAMWSTVIRSACGRKIISNIITLQSRKWKTNIMIGGKNDLFSSN